MITHALHPTLKTRKLHVEYWFDEAHQSYDRINILDPSTGYDIEDQFSDDEIEDILDLCDEHRNGYGSERLQLDPSCAECAALGATPSGWLPMLDRKTALAEAARLANEQDALYGVVAIGDGFDVVELASVALPRRTAKVRHVEVPDAVIAEAVA